MGTPNEKDVRTALRETLAEIKTEFTKRNFWIAVYTVFLVLPAFLGGVMAIIAVAFWSWLLMCFAFSLLFGTFLWVPLWGRVFRKIGNGNLDKGIDILVDRKLKKMERPKKFKG